MMPADEISARKVESGLLGLQAPDSFWATPSTDMVGKVGGCGPGVMGDRLVPDTVYGICITNACLIHDWSYRFIETTQDQVVADMMFLHNMLVIIHKKSKSKILLFFRKLRVFKYYLAVSVF
jgi:hypothetical protein